MKQRINKMAAETGAVYNATGSISVPSPRRAVRERKIVETALESIRTSLNSLSEAEMKRLARYFHPVPARTTSSSRAALVDALTEGNEYSELERVTFEAIAHYRGFERRKTLLEGALTAPEVARLLGTSRQTPHDRAKSKTLLAISDGGMLRFPLWQFDAAGPHGVIAGLPDVLRVLNAPPYSQAVWLTRPNAHLQERTPLEELKRGRIGRVVELARAVGAFSA